MTLFLIVAFIIFAAFGLVVFRGAPYVPSHRKDVARAFRELYPLSKKDVLIDIGSGDGVVLRAAARLGVKKAIGYEINPFLVAISGFISRRSNVVEVRMTDMWLAKFPDDVTVVYIFMVSRDSKRMAKKLQTEANRTGQTIAVITYGSELYGNEPVSAVGAHHLYQIRPLQAE